MLGPRVENLGDIWGEELLSLEWESSSDFEKQRTSCKTLNNYPAEDKIDPIHTKMTEFEHLLEASGEGSLRRINLAHGDYPCHYAAQTVW